MRSVLGSSSVVLVILRGRKRGWLATVQFICGLGLVRMKTGTLGTYPVPSPYVREADS